ncbi:protein glass [Caerostris extrusa]|uniref:Protein glass n=1 Tax=Caerostris extrusa TaxID=172846 RepID=A0AAV4NMB2_CAEEX|nr:protein glass [Caerostris extrusa]
MLTKLSLLLLLKRKTVTKDYIPRGVQYNSPSPTHPTAGASGTYTFTAEFRPADSMSLPSIEREYSNCGSNLKSMTGSFYPYKAWICNCSY